MRQWREATNNHHDQSHSDLSNSRHLSTACRHLSTASFSLLQLIGLWSLHRRMSTGRSGKAIEAFSIISTTTWLYFLLFFFVFQRKLIHYLQRYLHVFLLVFLRNNACHISYRMWTPLFQNVIKTKGLHCIKGRRSVIKFRPSKIRKFADFSFYSDLRTFRKCGSLRICDLWTVYERLLAFGTVLRHSNMGFRILKYILMKENKHFLETNQYGSGSETLLFSL